MKNEQGFTITEILVALLLFSLVAVPLTATFHRLASDTAVKDKYKAVELASNEMEKILAYRYNDKEKKSIYEGFTIISKIDGDTLKRVKVEVFKRELKLYTLNSYIYLE